MPAKATARSSRDRTDAELLLLGLLAEMPRHGYQLEQEIARRGMREWTQIGFSSVYFVLGRLEAAGLVAAGKKREAGPKARKTFRLTPAGRRVLVAQTLAALRTYRPTYSSVLLGMMHWPVLTREQALRALEVRGRAVALEMSRLRTLQGDYPPMPDYVDSLFDFSLGQLQAEAGWIARTLEYMKTKPWLE